MRTTLALNDELLEAARARARARGVSIGTVVEDALRRAFAAEEGEPTAPAVPVFRYDSGVRAGVDLASNRAIYELLDEGTDLDRMR
jgi:hypothetical protein